MIFAPFVVVIVLGAIWSAFWFYATSQAQATLAAWREQEAKLGRIYTCGSQTIGGFPFRIEVRCADVDVELTATQPPLNIKAKDIVVVAQVYDPTLLIGEVTGPLRVAERGQPLLLSVDWTLAQVSLRGFPIAPQRLSMTMDGVHLDRRAANGSAFELFAKASRAEFHVRLDPESKPEKPVLDLAIRLSAAVIPGLGQFANEPLDADIGAVVRGLKNFAPKPTRVLLREFQAEGGKVEITSARMQRADVIAVSAGTLGLSNRGAVNGSLRVTVAGIERLIDQLGGIEALAPGLKLPEAKNGGSNNLDRLMGNLDRVVPGLGGVVRNNATPGLLALLGPPTQLEGRPAIALALRFDDGRAALGPIPLGQIPPLY
jgi:hypothetical protein